MKKFYCVFALTFLFLFVSAELFAQAVTDPASIPVYEASGPITVDGVLDESDWAARAPHLMFRFDGSPSELSYTPTNDGLEVKPVYADTSTNYVKFLRSGTNLYISMDSDDKQVCRFGDSWEGDGLFMKIKNSVGTDVEFKLYYNLAGTNPEINYEGPAYGNGAGYKKPGTIVNDSTNVDAGYSAELMIDLTGLGFTASTTSIELMLVIFDPDNYSDGVGAWGPNGNFGKQWWGSEWGPDMRTLEFMDGPSQYDPASLTAYSAAGSITVDGVLDEPDWSVDTPHLMFKFDGIPSGMSYTPTNSGLVVKPVYADTSTCYVKFLRSGTNLYISLDSDDKQVCRFGDSWEGDGLFMKIKNSVGTDVEFKLYYNLAGTNPEINYEGPAYGNGAGYKKPGTIVNDSTNVDAGYSAELMIDLTGLGFTASTTSIELMLVIFDPDNYSDGVGAWGPNGNFGKQWWGSEWGPDMRTLMLSNTVVPVELTTFAGSYVGNTAQLLWSTSSETNNYGFEIQRSNSSEFVTVGFVQGNGTTTNMQYYSYTDKEILPGTSYSYRLKQIDFNGQFEFSNVIELGPSNLVDFNLSQNYPNPFNPGTKISFSLPVKSNVKLDVYNMLGQKVISLFNGNLEAGNHNMDLNASELTSGIYIYSINAVGENGSKFVSSKKMTLIK